MLQICEVNKRTLKVKGQNQIILIFLDMLKGLVHLEYHHFIATLGRVQTDPDYKWLWYEVVLYSYGLWGRQILQSAAQG